MRERHDLTKPITSSTTYREITYKGKYYQSLTVFKNGDIHLVGFDGLIHKIKNQDFDENQLSIKHETYER